MRLDFLVVAAFVVTKISCASWGRHEKLLRSYFNIEVPNILRCEELCERQPKCASVTFDSQERVCYMHLAKAFLLDIGRGKYFHTTVASGRKTLATNRCGDEQMYLPTAMGAATCRDIQCGDIREYLGCFKDVTGSRDLTFSGGFRLTNSTKNLCVSTCQSNALLVGGNCKKNATLMISSDYSTASVDGSFSTRGFFAHGDNSGIILWREAELPLMKRRVKPSASLMAILPGYKYAGLQFGNECWCGNSYGQYGLIAEDHCSYPCSGNAKENCGGSDANSVYSTGL